MARTSIIKQNPKKDMMYDKTCSGVGWRTVAGGLVQLHWMADSEALRGGAKTAESGGSNRQVQEEKTPKEREGLPNGKVGAK